MVQVLGKEVGSTGYGLMGNSMIKLLTAGFADHFRRPYLAQKPSVAGDSFQGHESGFGQWSGYVERWRALWHRRPQLFTFA